jgi:hypothetical protein
MCANACDSGVFAFPVLGFVNFFNGVEANRMRREADEDTDEDDLSSGTGNAKGAPTAGLDPIGIGPAGRVLGIASNKD